MITMEYKIEGKYIQLFFSERPNEKIIQTLKICGWHYYYKTKCWSKTYNSENLIWAKKMADEINTNRMITSKNIDVRLINQSDIIVRGNNIPCYKHHEVIDVVGEVSIIDQGGNNRNVSVPLAYCESCDLYYILEDAYQSLRKKGLAKCRIILLEEYELLGAMNANNYIEPSSLAFDDT